MVLSPLMVILMLNKIRVDEIDKYVVKEEMKNHLQQFPKKLRLYYYNKLTKEYYGPIP